MTPDERNLLNDLANKIAQTPPPPKDQEAEDFIRTHIGSRPDALYLMTQTVLIQNLALQHAQQQIQELQQRTGQPVPVGSGSFLGQGQQAGTSGYAPRPSQPPPPQYAPPSPSGPAPGTGAPSFLRGAAQTAAGVAAGALAFEGISSLFGHSGYGGGGFLGGGGGFMGGGGIGGAPVEETVVNNYYDNPGDASPGDYQAGGSGNDYQNAVDDSGVSDDSGQYEDANYDTGDDGGGFDDNSGGGDFA